MSDEPKTITTYRWADGNVADESDEYVLDEVWFTEEAPYRLDEPCEYVVETWERKTVESRWVFPVLWTCGYATCDRDAVAWVRRDDGWMQVCDLHDSRRREER